MHSLICLTMVLVTTIWKVATDEEIVKIIMLSLTVLFLFLSFIFASVAVKGAIALILLLDNLIGTSIILRRHPYLHFD